MSLTSGQVTVLGHFLRSVAGLVVAAAIAFAASPDLIGVLTKNEAIVVASVLVPLLAAAEKYLRTSPAV